MTERELTIEADGTLAGSLLLPDGPAPCPGLLIVPGSGASDRDGNVRAGPALTLVVPAEEAANRAAYADPHVPVAPALVDAIARFVLEPRQMTPASGGVVLSPPCQR